VARQATLILAGLLIAFGLGTPAHAYDPSIPQTPWTRLSPDERRILGPIAADWEHLPGFQQQRLIASARRYPSLLPIQKERFDDRIREWASMTPEQRRAARETFQGLRKLPPEKQHELRERWLRERQGGVQAPRARGPEEGRSRGGRPEGPSQR
jgi:Protein of unknown function (DUF3106)